MALKPLKFVVKDIQDNDVHVIVIDSTHVYLSYDNERGWPYHIGQLLEPMKSIIREYLVDIWSWCHCENGKTAFETEELLFLEDLEYLPTKHHYRCKSCNGILQVG